MNHSFKKTYSRFSINHFSSITSKFTVRLNNSMICLRQTNLICIFCCLSFCSSFINPFKDSQTQTWFSSQDSIVNPISTTFAADHKFLASLDLEAISSTFSLGICIHLCMFIHIHIHICMLGL